MQLYVMSDDSLLEELLDKEIDGIILGVAPFAHRVRGAFSPDVLAGLSARAKRAGKKVFFMMNAVMFEDDLPHLEERLDAVRSMLFDGIIFADLAVLNIARRLGLENYLIYHPETYTTHPGDVSFFAPADIHAVVLSRELTLDAIEAFAETSALPLAFVGHGYVNVFHSYRRLLKTFAEHTGDFDADCYEGVRLSLLERERETEYPFVQDAHGTHVYRTLPRASFNAFDRLGEVLDYFFIDTLFYERKRVLDIVDDYITLNKGETPDALHERYSDHDEGFLRLPTHERKGDAG